MGCAASSAVQEQQRTIHDLEDRVQFLEKALEETLALAGDTSDGYDEVSSTDDVELRRSLGLAQPRSTPPGSEKQAAIRAATRMSRPYSPT